MDGACLPFLRRGFVDLYSGRCAVARSLARRFGVWVVTVDLEHGGDQNLLDAELQRDLLDLLKTDCCLGFGAAPECCSFSRAVCPPVRSARLPFGLPGISANMEEKVRRGNRHAAFLLQFLSVAAERELPYWIENPDGSFLWLLDTWAQRG